MKSKFEHNFKKQLEDRELSVSDNAWDRLQEMMAEPEAKIVKTHKINFWLPFSIAASVVLIFGWYFGWNSMAQNDSPTIANQVKTKEILEKVQEENKLSSIPVQEDLLADSSVQPEIILTQKTETTQKNLIKKEEIKEVEIFPNSEPNKQNSIEQTLQNEISPEPTTQIAHQGETKIEEKKKANYVDPEMLLYSIENNEAVKQSKSNSRLVLIDFNK